jgi:hypothetical protein
MEMAGTPELSICGILSHFATHGRWVIATGEALHERRRYAGDVAPAFDGQRVPRLGTSTISVTPLLRC